MSQSSGRRRGQDVAGRWATIRYALDSTPRTVRLCVIFLVAGAPVSSLLLLLAHR
jgi:hypothetical protein